MANKKFFVGIMAVMLVFGMVLAGCDDGSSGGSEENTDPKKITITGLDGKSGTVMVYLTTGGDEDGTVAVGSGTISGSTATVLLKKRDSTDWTGTGSYYMVLRIGESESYIYTNGKTFAELGVAGPGDEKKLPKISITVTTTSVALNKFHSPNG